MRVIGIDPGLTRTGWAVVERKAGKLALLDAGVVATAPSVQASVRLWELWRALTDILARFRPDAMSCERVFFSRNVSTAISVGQASGVALAAAAAAGVPVSDRTPTEVKLTITGSGTAPKKQVQSMVAAILSLPAAPQPADAADACALAICHLQRSGLDEALAGARR